MAELCPDNEIAELTRALEGNGDDVAETGRLLANYPNDPRLHFLMGSVLAGLNRAVEAHASLSRAVELAPDFHLARYQLGFFQLTSGEADRALATWGPLLRLPESTYLRHFVEGLTAFIRDEFGAALEHMRRGIALNQENEPMNNDIRLLMAEAQKLHDADSCGPSGEDGISELSATSLLLGQSQKPITRH
jgi:Flp pilus assembly protein TadD